jgi:hypothetical protein
LLQRASRRRPFAGVLAGGTTSRVGVVSARIDLRPPPPPPLMRSPTSTKKQEVC